MHVKRLIAKFWARIWCVRHLKYAKIPRTDVVSLYESLVRPILDFACPAYHSLLTRGQCESLERLQKHALKIIHGWNVSYAASLEHTGLEKLEDRRERLVEQFANKAATHPRFALEWFPEKITRREGLRENEVYHHIRPRTERYKRNPVYYMKKMMEPRE